MKKLLEMPEQNNGNGTTLFIKTHLIRSSISLICRSRDIELKNNFFYLDGRSSSKGIGYEVEYADGLPWWTFQSAGIAPTCSARFSPEGLIPSEPGRRSPIRN